MLPPTSVRRRRQPPRRAAAEPASQPLPCPSQPPSEPYGQGRRPPPRLRTGRSRRPEGVGELARPRACGCRGVYKYSCRRLGAAGSGGVTTSCRSAASPWRMMGGRVGLVGPVGGGSGNRRTHALAGAPVESDGRAGWALGRASLVQRRA